MDLNVEVIQGDLLPSLRADFISVMETEVRAVLINEKVVIQTDAWVVRPSFDDFKTVITTALTSLR